MSQSTSTIDLASLPEDVRRHVQYALSSALERETAREKWAALVECGTDEEIIAAAQDYMGGGTPVTLANRYDKVPRHCEIRGICFACHSHPRRPVIMRGAKWARIAAFGFSDHLCANGWATEVYRRAIRMSKMTILDDGEFEIFSLGIVRRLSKKYRLTSAFREYKYIGKERITGHGNTAIIRGKFRYLKNSEWENISRLHNIIKKAERLEDRIQAARAHFRARMAA